MAVANHPRARTVPGIDERSLGFWALGYSKAKQIPCVVITSSGTAVANLLPAVVEASQSNVPLILLTADRPAELRDTGSNQTIRQPGIFGDYVRWGIDLQAPTENVPLRSTLTCIANAMRYSCSPSDPGPVHINCQFREPLHPTNVEWNRSALEGLSNWLVGNEAFTGISIGTYGPPKNIDRTLFSKIQACRKGLIVVGELSNREDVMASVKLAEALGWPVIADVLSGIRVGNRTRGNRMNLINYYDHILLEEELWGHMQPDIILHLGGRMTSKRLSNFVQWCVLNESSCSEWIQVNRYLSRFDPPHLVHGRIDCPLPDFLEAIRRHGIIKNSVQKYSENISALNDLASSSINGVLDSVSLLSEAHVARLISDRLPQGHGLFVGNSMPIRDMDMFGAPLVIDDCSSQYIGSPIAANRGASGIDGILSTASGFADGLGRKCTLIVGDISFIHDINGLNMLRTGGLQPPLTVVLINNSGGGIFDFLPISQSVPEDQFRPLWTTPQHVDIAGK